jgi:DNA end-binding protein Ku
VKTKRRGNGGSIGTAEPAKPSKKPRKGASGQKEMLMPIEGKKVAKEAAAKKPASRSESQPSGSGRSETIRRDFSRGN